MHRLLVLVYSISAFKEYILFCQFTLGYHFYRPYQSLCLRDFLGFFLKSNLNRFIGIHKYDKSDMTYEMRWMFVDLLFSVDRSMRWMF